MKAHQEMETKPYTMTSHQNQQLCVTQFFIRPPGGTSLSKLYPTLEKGRWDSLENSSLIICINKMIPKRHMSFW